MKQSPDNVAIYFGPINDSIIPLVNGTVASHNRPMEAPKSIAMTGDGGDNTKIVMAKDLHK